MKIDGNFSFIHSFIYYYGSTEPFVRLAILICVGFFLAINFTIDSNWVNKYFVVIKLIKLI